MSATSLLLISDRAALAWVLQEQKMAFSEFRSGDAARLAKGTTLLLYATRGCFRNPTRDRGRVIGRALTLTTAHALDEPVRFANRVFAIGLGLKLTALAPYGSGVVLAELVNDLELFPDAATWSARIRRTVVPLSEADASLIDSMLDPMLTEIDTAVGSYLAKIPEART